MTTPHVAQLLHAAGVPSFPCREDKSPAVKKGEDWKQVALRPFEVLHWPSALAGVPIPPGITVIDLDTYKGVTREAVDHLLGYAMPWDNALVQTTMQGGQHYAFRCDWEVLQGSNLHGLKGFDTRCAGMGYICTGGPYQSVGMGVSRLGYPATLPLLPEQVRPLLEKQVHEPSTHELPQGDADVDNIREALRHVSPGLGRSEWLRIGLALRHQFHDDETTGQAIFREWSSGELWPDGTPHNYVEETTDNQFLSFKPEGATTISTLFYAAIQNGWRPPADASIDISSAFGPGAAPVEEYYAAIDRVQEHGGDPKYTSELIAEIHGMTCNPVQRAAILATLTREIKDAGLLTKAIKQKLDSDAGTPSAPRIDGPEALHAQITDVSQIPARALSRPETSHGDNANAMIREVFGHRVGVINGRLRWWSGCEWQTIGEDDLDTLCFIALSPGKSTATNVQGTKKALTALSPKLPDPLRDRRVFFLNGVLDLDNLTAGLQPHCKDNHNTGVLSVNYTPNQCFPEWSAFVSSLFEGEEDGHERRNLLQEIIGYTLFRDNLNTQKALALDGATRAGKGVALEIIAHILGPQACGAFAFSNIGDGKTQSAFRNYDVMIDMEAKPPMRNTSSLAVGFLNKVASNEVVSIQLLNKQDPWAGRLNCKMLIACNGVPTMIDDSGASSNRFHALKYTRSFEGKEDKGLLGRLYPELPAITAWAIDGALRLIANDGRFTVPATSQEAADDMKGASQPLREFLGDCATFAPNSTVHSSAIWTAYQQWAVEANVRLPSRGSFYKSLDQTLLGTAAARSRAVRVNGLVSTGYHGLTITSPLAAVFTPPDLKAVK